MADEKKVVAEVNAPEPVVKPAPATLPVQPAPYVYQAPLPMPALPRICITRQALFEMTNEVLAHPTIETAWGLYGFRYPKVIFIVGVIRPVSGEVVRGYANAEAGGEEMANAMRWLYANEKLINVHVRGGKSGLGKFCFLYKGHSHHTLGYGQYSGTDHSSIYQAVKNDGMEIAIGPLALIRKNQVSYDQKLWGEEISCSRQSEVAFLFYVMTKAMVDAGYTQGEKVKPTIVDTVHTLLVPPLGWEFSKDDDFKEQLRHMKSFGYSVTVNHIDANGKPPMEIQFIIDDTSFKQSLIITTDWNYPEVAPKIQLLPKKGSSMTMTEANRLSALNWWNKGDDFIDVIGRMIQKGGLK